MRKRVKRGEYGTILIVRGEHAGRVGYYDDDEGSKAVVYFGRVLRDEYYLIPREWIRKTNVIHLPALTN